VLLNVWEKNGIDRAFEIIICDEPLDPGDLHGNDVILYSFMTSSLPGVHQEIEKIRKKKVLIAGGGPHITGDQELPFEMGFDTLFVGAGESNFLQFGLDLLDNRPVKNLYHCEDSVNSFGDFNGYHPVSRHLATAAPLEIMRGCFWNCSYCSTHLNKAWFRDIDSIAAYLRELQRRDIKRVNFISPSSLEYGAPGPGQVVVHKIKELLELIGSYHFRFMEYGIFPSEIRPDTVNVEGMALLKRYVSNKSITLGAQSSLDSRLEELNRGHRVEDIERAVAIARAAGFSVNLDFILGYPNETPGERRANVDFIKTLNKAYGIKAHLHFFIPLPASIYANRFPTFLPEEEKEQFQRLRTAGIATGGWRENEEQARAYLHWLKECFPAYYSRYY
jgi:B12-binding domain/radical SAM domain protein